MKDIIKTMVLLLFFPETTIQKKAAEFHRTRKERYKRKEYKYKKKSRKFNHPDLFHGNAIFKFFDSVFKV